VNGSEPLVATRRATAYRLGAVLLLCGCAALAIDLPVAQAVLAEKQGRAAAVHIPGDLRKAVNLCEAFAHGAGAALILLAVLVVDRGRRRRLPRMIAATTVAGLAGNLLKLLVHRTRPEASDLGGDVWQTFVGWLPMSGAGHAGQSFPSGHAATAAGLALALSWRWPHGRWLFACYAVLASAQRVLTGAHFVSDVLIGAGVGLLVGSLCIDRRLTGPTFDRLEGVASAHADRSATTNAS